MAIVALKELLEAGVHFGHQVKRWNPKMAPYIYTARDDIHVIDLAKTRDCLETAIAFLTQVAASGKPICFVGTKKQAQAIVEEEARRCGAFFVTARWVGGLLTNWEEIQKTLRRMDSLEQQKIKGEHEKFTKKENLLMDRELSRLNHLFSGVRGLSELPGVLVVAGAKQDINAILEARKRGVPIIAICDTNSNPSLVDYPIPGNDDAVKAIRLIMSKLADATASGRAAWEKSQVEGEAAPEEKQKTTVAQKETKKPAKKKAAADKTVRKKAVKKGEKA